MESIESPHVTLGERELWERGRDGHGRAFGDIFDRHKDRVFRHAYRLLHDRHDAEDVTGTAFLELWRRRDAVRLVDGSVLPWLIVVTTNAALNVRRSTRRYRSLLDRLPRGENHASAEEEALARAGTFSSAVQHELKRMDAIDRGLVALVILHEFTATDAATALGIAPGTARTRLSRLRARLRTTLATQAPDAASTAADPRSPGIPPDPSAPETPGDRVSPSGSPRLTTEGGHA